MSIALIIDDALMMRAILRKFLQDAGYRTVEAANGSDGLARLHATPGVELALVDCNMPVMDGMEFLRQVRSSPQYTGLRIMMVTSDTDIHQVEHALALGANEYIMKPFTREAVLEKLAILQAPGR